MNIFAVHLLPEDVLSWSIRVPHRDQTTIVSYRTLRGALEEPHIEEIPSDSYGKRSMWYANNEEAANSLAELLASQNPNREVRVYKLQSVTRAPAAKPVRAVLTEKGLVPE